MAFFQRCRNATGLATSPRKGRKMSMVIITAQCETFLSFRSVQQIFARWEASGQWFRLGGRTVEMCEGKFLRGGDRRASGSLQDAEHTGPGRVHRVGIHGAATIFRGLCPIWETAPCGFCLPQGVQALDVQSKTYQIPLALQAAQAKMAGKAQDPLKPTEVHLH